MGLGGREGGLSPVGCSWMTLWASTGRDFRVSTLGSSWGRKLKMTVNPATMPKAVHSSCMAVRPACRGKSRHRERLCGGGTIKSQEQLLQGSTSPSPPNIRDPRPNPQSRCSHSNHHGVTHLGLLWGEGADAQVPPPPPTKSCYCSTQPLGAARVWAHGVNGPGWGQGRGHIPCLWPIALATWAWLGWGVLLGVNRAEGLGG